MSEIQELGFDLQDLLTDPLPKDSDYQRILEVLAETDSISFPCEQKQRGELLSQKIPYIYPQISLEFLSLNNEVELSEQSDFYHPNPDTHKIMLPRFSVYRFDKTSMRIQLKYESEFLMGKYLYINIVDLPKIIESAIIKSLEYSDKISTPNWNGGRHVLRFSFFPKEERRDIIKKYKGLFESPNGIEIVSHFNALIPLKVKKKIKEAEEMFGKNIYFVTETKPEEWNVERIVSKDPLVIGVSEDICFYIGKFNPTSLENYLEQTSGMKNKGN